ncbi:hypothetical protein L1N85_10690 [Paenibacillus alkaliterrae]|uniref:hypothetical protein n=1 Tax=Paenibacillus alkaliterrae TaxID=320909 RepID=UPI001F2E9419|nr:hypothetical protein [Paenibacillus alkaliterrae]MCF2938903.1 hypothetical protein [Paenibacillus alkaliterrae]
MAKTLEDIRFLIEQEVKTPIENQDVINWCNQVNADIGMNINIPATPSSIALTATALEYTLPTNLKIINRLRLQSIINEGIDTEFGVNYRIYNGKIIFPRTLWIAPDTLVVDYYKHLTTFTLITNAIELDDRYYPIYQFYGLLKYYRQPSVVSQLGEAHARRESETNERLYNGMKNQLTAYQMLGNEPVVIDSRW